MQRAPRVLVAVTLAVLSAVTLSAQNNRDKKEDANVRAVEGAVLGLDQKPTAKAIVQLKDTKSLQVRSYVTQDDGMYHFAGLRTDTDYELTASLDALKSGTKRLSTFDGRKIASIVLQLEKK